MGMSAAVYLLRVVLLLVAAVLPAWSAAADDRNIDGVPLPADVRVVPLAASAPGEHESFLGAWIGAWGQSNRHILVVEEISADGSARLVYAWADSGPTQRGWRRLDGKIEARTLSIRDNFSALYTLTGPASAHGAWRRGERRSETEMRKVALEDLLAPGAVPAWPLAEPAAGGKNAQPMPDPGEVTLTAEKTLAKGAYISRNAPGKGILLHLHGCNGFARGGFTDAWLDTFEKAGFKVVVPNSFAEARPEPSCKTAPPFPDQVEINDLRVAQTLRVTELLQKAYPGVPIYVWGHSEGASLAYLLPVKYAGVVATGHVCGHRALATNKIPRDVPLLVLNGSDTRDPYLSVNIRAGRHGSMAALCGRVLQGNPGWRWVQIPDLAHFIPIWHPVAWAEVAKLMGLEGAYQGADASAAEPPPFLELAPKAREMFEGRYHNIKVPKVFAAAPDGTWAYSSVASSLQDARLDALYRCNSFLGSRFPAEKCTVYAEGDRVLARK